MTASDLRAHFQRLADDELLRRAASGELTALAQDIARAEIVGRGLPVPPLPVAEPAPEPAYLGDMTLVARMLTPTEAHVLCACLQAAGVPAQTADTQLVQTNALLSPALGGASIRVPAQFVDEARQVIAAYRRGDFRLPPHFDPGEPEPD